MRSPEDRSAQGTGPTCRAQTTSEILAPWVSTPRATAGLGYPTSGLRDTD